MADENYKIPENPCYWVDQIRKLQDNDPASATYTFNPLIQKILESIAYHHQHKADLDADGKVSPYQLPDYGAMLRGALPERIDFAIPADGWMPGSEHQVPADFFLDIPLEQSRAVLVPYVSICQESLADATSCGLSTSVQSEDGYIRLFSQEVPEKDMPASLMLFSVSDGTGKDDDVPYLIPVATADKVGGVRVSAGSGLQIDAQGNLALDAASGGELAALFTPSGGQTRARPADSVSP